MLKVKYRDSWRSTVLSEACLWTGSWTLKEKKFSQGKERFGLLVKVGHWSLWWVMLFWGRLYDDAQPAQTGNRRPHPSTWVRCSYSAAQIQTAGRLEQRDTSDHSASICFLSAHLSLILLQCESVSICISTVCCSCFSSTHLVAFAPKTQVLEWEAHCYLKMA